MEPVTHVIGRAYPLGRADIDTDTILPAAYLKTLDRTGLAAGAFERIRAVPENVFADPALAGAPILIAGANFGCGSSREHAVWAMLAIGLRAVIAPSFSDLFAANAARNGMVAAALPPSAIERLLVANAMLTIDVAALTVSTAAGECWPFPLDAFRREALLLGRDEIAFTLDYAPAIAAYEARGTIIPVVAD